MQLACVHPLNEELKCMRCVYVFYVLCVCECVLLDVNVIVGECVRKRERVKGCVTAQIPGPWEMTH